MSARRPPASIPASVDCSFLQALVGYNTRRATLKILAIFSQRIGPLELSVVEFSILSLIGRNPGLTPTQLCVELDLLPPNLTKLLTRLDQRKLVARAVPAADKRAVCLSLSSAGMELLAQAEAKVVKLEIDASSALTARERQRLISLLQKIYR